MKKNLILFGVATLVGIAYGYFMSKNKKAEISDEFIKDLKRIRKSNDSYCFVNDCDATDYMKGSNYILDKLITDNSV